MQIRLLILLLSLGVLACNKTPNSQADDSSISKADQAENPQASTAGNNADAGSGKKNWTPPAKVEEIEPAVIDPDGQRRPQGLDEMETVSLAPYGIDFELMLPPDHEISQPEAQLKELLITADGGAFQLKVGPTQIEPSQFHQRWLRQEGEYRFRRWLIKAPSALLVEVGHNAKAEFHMEYIYANPKDNIVYLIRSPKEVAFSRLQATKMFQACRSLDAGGRR